MITVTLVFIFINYSLNGGAAVYYAKNILHNENMVGTMNLVANLVQIGVMFFTAFIIKKIGKRNMLIIGAIIYGIGFAMFGFVGTKYGRHHYRLCAQGYRKCRNFLLYVRYRFRHN